MKYPIKYKLLFSPSKKAIKSEMPKMLEKTVTKVANEIEDIATKSKKDALAYHLSLIAVLYLLLPDDGKALFKDNLKANEELADSLAYIG